MTATKQRPDKDEIGRALERALGYAGKAADFGRKQRRSLLTCRTPSPGSAKAGQAVAASRPRRLRAWGWASAVSPLVNTSSVQLSIYGVWFLEAPQDGIVRGSPRLTKVKSAA